MNEKQESEKKLYTLNQPTNEMQKKNALTLENKANDMRLVMTA